MTKCRHHWMRNVQQRKTAKGILTCTKKKKRNKKKNQTQKLKILDSMSQFYHRSPSCDLCGIREVLYLLLSEWILFSKWWDWIKEGYIAIVFEDWGRHAVTFCINVHKENYRNNRPNTTLTFLMFGCFKIVFFFLFVFEIYLKWPLFLFESIYYDYSVQNL